MNLLVGQSGGPTAAINATLAGVISHAMLNSDIDKVLGSINGIEGVFKENFLDLSEFFKDASKLNILKQTPSAFLGSCRYKLKDEDILTIADILKKNDIGYFCYIGGNDSMDTVSKLSAVCGKMGINVMGIPKTIDNDLMGTDHCPGFGSAAKYIAATVSEIARDSLCYDLESVTIVEIMGRNAGWLTAASALARMSGSGAPDLIYLPEVIFDTDKFLEDIKNIMKHKKAVIVAVSEGIKDKDGNYIAQQTRATNNDLFGHSQLGGAGKTLEHLVKKRLGCKARSIELNTPQRCAAHITSKTDIEESFRIGYAGSKCATEGENGKMFCYVRKPGEEYICDIICQDISAIANAEKKVPEEYISENGSDVTEKFIKYAYPLIQGENDIAYKDGIPVHIFR